MITDKKCTDKYHQVISETDSEHTRAENMRSNNNSADWPYIYKNSSNWH